MTNTVTWQSIADLLFVASKRQQHLRSRSWGLRPEAWLILSRLVSWLVVYIMPRYLHGARWSNCLWFQIGSHKNLPYNCLDDFASTEPPLFCFTMITIISWSPTPVEFFAQALLTWLTALIVSRLLCHPLRKFPGDKLAALTGWYREYYDLLRDGDWVEQLERLHHKYGEFSLLMPLDCNTLTYISGPVVRVAPNEVRRAFCGRLRITHHRAQIVTL